MPTITGLTSVPAARVTRTQLVSEIGITAFVLSLAAGGALTAWLQQPWPMIVLRPIRAPLKTWQKCQIFAPSPITAPSSTTLLG